MSTVEFTLEGLFIIEHNPPNTGPLKINVVRGSVTGTIGHISLILITESNSVTGVKIITPINAAQIQSGVDISVISNPASNPPPSSVKHGATVDSYDFVLNLSPAHPGCRVDPAGIAGTIVIRSGESHTKTLSAMASYLLHRDPNPPTANDTIWLGKRALIVGQRFDLAANQSVVITINGSPFTILPFKPDTTYQISITNNCSGEVKNDFQDFYTAIVGAGGNPIPGTERYNLYSALVETISVESLVASAVGSAKPTRGSELYPCIVVTTGT